MKNKRTFVAKIAVGFREGYTQRVHTIDEVYEICHTYCDRVGLCVTVTPTRYIYSKGQGKLEGFEDGCFIELIAYPSFVASRYDVVGDALELAKIFLAEFKQNMIAIITSDETFTVDKRDLNGG